MDDLVPDGDRLPPVLESAARTLVIVGAGMAAQRFCERLVDHGLTDQWRVVMVGEESSAPYDRIRLGECILGMEAERLRLRPTWWYEQHGIELVLGARVVRIDREIRCVMTAGGSGYRYDHLVLATGSRPRVPAPFDHPDERILTYRTADDAVAIRDVIDSAGGGTRAIVVGGGLLGLEVARDLQKRGSQVTIIEASSHLMSRQLDLLGSAALQRELGELGLKVKVAARVDAVDRDGDELVVRLQGGQELHADLAVVAIGVRPSDELARRAELSCYPGGGVKVDARMRTDDPRIDAIGECAVLDGEPVGLVAPCYDMADVVARRLAGRRAKYKPLPRVTKLKLDGIQVSVVGQALIDDNGYREDEVEGRSVYRRLVTRRGKLVGATVIGDWDDLPMVVEGVTRRARFGSVERIRFTEREPIWPERRDDIASWADEVPVCTCTGATCGSVRAAFREGCSTIEGIGRRTGAGTVCGSCEPILGQLVGVSLEPKRPDGSLALTGLVALLFLLLAAFSGSIEYATSVEPGGHFRLDDLWRDGLLRKISGFSLAGLCLLSLVVSLRKRISWFRLGSFRLFRLLHTALGVASVAALGIHTGFRMGSNLDFALSSIFVAIVCVGAAAALVTALEPRLTPRRAGALRRTTLRAHQILFWPFPILVVLHAIKAFYF